MNTLIFSLGAAAAFAFIFIVLLGIVEYIPVLKLFPSWKYSAPFALGTFIVIFAAIAKSGVIVWLTALVSILLAGWYSYEGMERGYAILKANEIRHKKSDDADQEKMRMHAKLPATTDGPTE